MAKLCIHTSGAWPLSHLLSTDNTLKGTSWLEKVPPKMEAKLLEPNSVKNNGVMLKTSEGPSLAPYISTSTTSPASTPWHTEPPLHPEVPSQGKSPKNQKTQSAYD